MDAPDVVNAFQQLPSRASREAAFDALINELDPYEWRRARARLSSRSFLFDIVGSLPPEIVIQIFKFLDISTPFRLQCVSRRWQTVLSSPDVLRGLLYLWDFNLEQPLPEKSLVISEDYIHCRKKAKLIHRFTSGKPASSIHIRLPEDSWPIDFDFFEETIAWLSRYRITTFNLRSGTSLSFVGEARETVQVTVLSSQLVVFYTYSGVWYACDLVTGQRKSFRLPSAQRPIFSCREKTMAGILLNEKGTGKHVAFSWDFDSQKCRTFDILDPEKDDLGVKEPSAVLVNPTSKSILICFKFKVHPKNMNLQYQLPCHRYDYSGNLIRSGTTGWMPPTQDPAFFKPTDRRGHFRLWLQGPVAFWADDSPLEMYYQEYEESSDHFEEYSCPSSCGSRWLDTAYRLDHEEGIECLGTSGKLCSRKIPITWEDGYPEHYPLEINSNFIALSGKRSIHLWSFDPDFKFPREELKALGLNIIG